MPQQEGWQFCHKCSCMFFGANPGHCVAGGEHDAQGFRFVLPFDNPPGPHAQEDWGFCNKCSVMFFANIPGHCVRGGGHDSHGSFNFVLPHDVAEAPGTQRNWRFCRKCSALFFGGIPGHCVQGGGHDPHGSFDFVLPHGAGFVQPTEHDFITLSSVRHPPGRRFLEGRDDRGVDLAADAKSFHAVWQRHRRGNLWILECFGIVSGEQHRILAGSVTGTVLLNRRQDGPGGKAQEWKATPVGDAFTLQCLALSGSHFLDGAQDKLGLTATGTQWTVGTPPGAKLPME